MKINHQPVRVRFAPSPTGHFHLGSARTALYNYLLARQKGGQFILRIEDTDRKRFVAGAEEEIKTTMRWLGLTWDEGPDIGGPFGPYRQSERKDIYKKYAQQLIDSGNAFYCFCSSERLGKVHQDQQKRKQSYRYDGTCRNIPPEEAAQRAANGEPHVIRYKMPMVGSTSTRDLVRGEIMVENHTLDDFILVKSDGLALYHLAAVVDDHLMEISHVIRGSEWLPTFPLHSLIHKAFGWQEPEWVHLSVFLKPSGKGKMSKREAADLQKDGYSIFVQYLRELGYLPEGLVNWIALMGWSLDGHTEFFTLQDLVDKFDLSRLNPSPAAINFSKLDHFNGLHIRNLAVPELAERVLPYIEAAGHKVDKDLLQQIIPVIQPRLITLDDAPNVASVFFKESVEPIPEELIAKKLTAEQSLEVARLSYGVLADLSDMRLETVEGPMRTLVETMELKAGQVFGVLRVAVTGERISPPLFETMEIIGREKVLERIQHAIGLLEQLIGDGV